MTTLFTIADNRLVLAEGYRDRFTIPIDEFGQALAYSSDTLIVFYDERGSKTYAITPSSFRHLAGGFFFLSRHLHHFWFRLGRLELEGLRGATPEYVWDAKRVYYLNGSVTGADARSFVVLQTGWARDSSRAYFNGQAILDADPAAFRALGDDFATDGQRLFGFGGVVIGPYVSDPLSLGRGYFRIGASIYFGSECIPEAEPESFRVLPLLTATDKRALWSRGGPTNESEAFAVDGFTATDEKHLYRASHHRARPPARGV